jgi:signal transduction histidine kinase
VWNLSAAPCYGASLMEWAAARALGHIHLGSLWRRITVHPPLAWFTFLCAWVGMAYAAFFMQGFTLVHALAGPVRILVAARGAALFIMAACSLHFLMFRSVTGFRLCLVVRVACLLVYLAEGPYRAGIEVALIAPLLLEIAVYEAFFLNLLFCIAVSALSVLVRAFTLLDPSKSVVVSAGPPSQWMPSASAFFLYLLAFSVTACFLIHYREKCIDQIDRIAQLETAVERLTATNLGYQNFASEASALSQKEERLRITRELHDAIGYTFTNNIMMLEAAVSKIRKDPPKVRELIRMARANTETGLESVRKTLYQLRSQEPVRVPSANKISDLIRVFRIATGIEVSVDFANFPNDLDVDRERAFYAFIQQALTNAFRHGAATSIAVQLLRTDRSLMAIVSDNGRGAEAITEGIGITGMRERLSKLGGELRITTMRNDFRIIAEVPYAEDADER